MRDDAIDLHHRGLQLSLDLLCFREVATRLLEQEVDFLADSSARHTYPELAASRKFATSALLSCA
jgi:hypothetical protein